MLFLVCRVMGHKLYELDYKRSSEPHLYCHRCGIVVDAMQQARDYQVARLHKSLGKELQSGLVSSDKPVR